MRDGSPILRPSPFDGSEVRFCDECDDEGCTLIIGKGLEIDLLFPEDRMKSLDERRQLCADRWNYRVYEEALKRTETEKRMDLTEIIERDTPQKLKKGHPYLTEGDEFICPNCDGHIRTYGLKMKCCYHCGQRIDWSEK